jgi:hypothetical protein
MTVLLSSSSSSGHSLRNCRFFFVNLNHQMHERSSSRSLASRNNIPLRHDRAGTHALCMPCRPHKSRIHCFCIITVSLVPFFSLRYYIILISKSITNKKLQTTIALHYLISLTMSTCVRVRVSRSSCIK